jgi:single-strand DNA-binding protein
MSINKVLLIGFLGQDPTYSVSASGIAVAKISLATNKKYTDNDNIKREKTVWHNCVAFRQLAEVINKYCKKGDQVYIEGELNYRVVENNGTKHYYTDIVVNTINFIDSKNKNHVNEIMEKSEATAKQEVQQEVKKRMTRILYDEHGNKVEIEI